MMDAVIGDELEVRVVRVVMYQGRDFGMDRSGDLKDPRKMSSLAEYGKQDCLVAMP